jgi:ParB-like chromosome segregation protein Spo0J
MTRRKEQQETMLSVWPANGGDVSIALTDKAMKVHPLCQLFGQIAPLSKKHRADMVEDIKRNGMKIPILINEAGDTIIDGHTRWMIAYDLGLRKSQVPIQRFKGKEEEVEREILSRNLFRRHMTDEQRVAIVSKLEGPRLEKEAKERQRAAGGDKRSEAYPENSGSDSGEAGSSTASDENSISFGEGVAEGSEVVDQIAACAGVSRHKAKQAEKARKAGVLDDVITKKTKLRDAAKKARLREQLTKQIDEALAGLHLSKKRKPKKELPFEDVVYKKWNAWLDKFGSQKRRVMELVEGWIEPKGDPK